MGLHHKMCHTLGGTVPGVGPDLAHVGTRLDRSHLLTSMLDPQADILYPFEGTGVDTTWYFELPPAGNFFNFASLFDVVVADIRRDPLHL